MRSKQGPWIEKLALMVVACALTLVGFEGVLRLVLPQKLYRFPRGLFRNDPELVFSMTPGFVGVMSSPEFQTHVQINSFGLRGPEIGTGKAARRRVLVLGDSFVSALNVETQDTFVAVFEKELKRERVAESFEVVNGGTPNYGTWHEVRLLRRLLPLLDPDLVILCVYVGNDVDDNLNPRKALVRDGLLVERNPSSGILPKSIRVFLQRKSMAYVFLWNDWNRIKGWMGWDAMDPEAAFRALIETQARPRIEEGYRVSEALLAELKTDLTSKQIPLGIVLIPASIQVDVEEAQTALGIKAERGSSYNLALPNRRWGEIARRLGLPLVDLLPLFQSRGGGPSLYMKLDGHLTQEGNRVAGGAMARHLSPLLPMVAKRGS